jgi:serine/threonine protein phosphatase PrpC
VGIEEKGRGAVAWAQGVGHSRYEDRYRLLTAAVPRVARAGRGEIVAVFDGIGGLRLGMHAAQGMANALLRFYREPERYPARGEGVRAVVADSAAKLRDAAATCGRETGCAGTVAWLHGDGGVFLFHAGDTLGLLVHHETHQVLTPAQPMEGPDANYFGMPRGLRIQAVETCAQPGDRLVLVSDGVTAALAPHQIAKIARGAPQVREVAERLAKTALDRGTLDDVTALVLEVS